MVRVVVVVMVVMAVVMSVLVVIMGTVVTVMVPMVVMVLVLVVMVIISLLLERKLAIFWSLDLSCGSLLLPSSLEVTRKSAPHSCLLSTLGVAQQGGPSWPG